MGVFVSRRTGSSPFADRSRESMLEAWLERHDPEISAMGGKSRDWVRRRLKTLVPNAAGLFPDIDPLVHHGGKITKVKWGYEPVSPSGNGIEGFELLLDRIGPVAVGIVREGLALLADPGLPTKLQSVGVQPGRERGHLDWFLAKDKGAERLVTRLGEEVAAMLSSRLTLTEESLRVIASDPEVSQRALAGFLEGAGETARIQAEVLGEVPEDSPWQAPEGTSDLTIPEPDEILQLAQELCAFECGDSRGPLQEVNSEQFQSVLEALAARWDGRGGQHRRQAGAVDLSRAMRVRLAHTLIHPEYYRYVREPEGYEPQDDLHQCPSGESWSEVVIWFQTEGALAIKRGVKSRKLQTQDEEELLAQNLEENWRRLTRIFLDAYLDPRLTLDWTTECYSLTAVRGLGDLLEDVNDSPDSLDGKPTQPSNAKAPWDPPDEEANLDATARAYWRDRDVHLTETKEYLQFVLNPRHERQPYILIDHVVYFASRLVDDADRELFGADAPAPKAPGEALASARSERRHRARTWIEQELESVLHDAYGRIPTSRKAQRERAALGLLNPELDLVAAYSSSQPDDDDRVLMQEVGAVIRNAVVRATVLAVGTKARHYQEEMADG
jgi:hypothetical protein